MFFNVRPFIDLKYGEISSQRWTIVKMSANWKSMPMPASIFLVDRFRFSQSRSLSVSKKKIIIEWPVLFTAILKQTKNASERIMTLDRRGFETIVVYLSCPNSRSENCRKHVNYHDHALRFRHINFAESQCARYIRLPVSTVKQGHRAKTLCVCVCLLSSKWRKKKKCRLIFRVKLNFCFCWFSN